MVKIVTVATTTCIGFDPNTEWDMIVTFDSANDGTWKRRSVGGRVVFETTEFKEDGVGEDMKQDYAVTARNACYEAMLAAQYMMDEAQTPRQKNIAQALYRAHWALYLVLQDEIRKKKQDGAE